MIEILSAGCCDLVMDLGRFGQAASGVPLGGAADAAALACANGLVGNIQEAAGLEILLAGPRLRFPRGALVALTGAHFEARRDSGADVVWHETMVMRPGETLSLGRALAGCRCWLAVRGGIDVPEVLGSRSTFLPGGWGGYHGRPLAAGDALWLGSTARPVRLMCTEPAPASGPLLRVLPGPQLAGFSDSGLLACFTGAYHVAPSSDRRGLRLTGPRIDYTGGAIASQPVVPGAVQIPPDGQPIILGWDGPVTGGYPVVATVIEADLARLAQLKPGDAVRLTTVSLADARTARGSPTLRVYG